LESRCIPSPDRLEPYKKIIKDALYPDIYNNEFVDVYAGRKEIFNYRKAVTNDCIGVIELMIYYLECGNNFIIDIRDFNEELSIDLESMMDSIVNSLKECSPKVRKQYIQRLQKVVDNASVIGWGYHEDISDIFNKFLIHVE
jgi:hypothetical protein